MKVIITGVAMVFLIIHRNTKCIHAPKSGPHGQIEPLKKSKWTESRKLWYGLPIILGSLYLIQNVMNNESVLINTSK